MSPSNLGIVFGPSLMRPRPSGATVSLSSLVDYPYQARIVEMLIVFYPTVFPSESNRTGGISTVRSSSLQQVCARSPTRTCNKSALGMACHWFLLCFNIKNCSLKTPHGWGWGYDKYYVQDRCVLIISLIWLWILIHIFCVIIIKW